MTVQWIHLAIGLLMVTHLAVLAYIARRDSRPLTAATDVEERALTEERVECQHCGVTNEPEYRFCRQCVSELPRGSTVFQARPGPRSRQTM